MIRPKLRCSASALDLRTAAPFGISRWTRSAMGNLLVRVGDGAWEGLGEGAPNPRYGETQAEAIDALAAGCWTAPQTRAQLHELIMHAGAGVKGAAARSALDMALWDYFGKREQTPVRALLGLAGRTTPVTAYTIGLGPRDEMVRKTREAADRPLLKVKVGRPGDEEAVAAVRGVSGATLWVDANEAWPTPELALAKIERFAALGVSLVEQPLPAGRLAELAWLKRRSPVPLYADEDCTWEGPAMAELAEGYHGVNLKLDKCGGLLRAHGMLCDARDAGLSVMIGCNVASSLAITAAANLALAADHADLDGHLLLASDPYRGVSLDSEHRLVLPEGDGLGVSAR